MTTDLDMLHATVAMDPPRPPRSGKTFAACHAVAAAVEFGEPSIGCLVPYYAWISFIAPMLAGVMRDHDLPFACLARTRYASSSGETASIIDFIVPGRPNALRGRAEAIIDFDDREE